MWLAVANPLVSIVAINFNYARFLRDAIDSALNQSYPRTEVIVVDDGSTDNSREIISTYGDRVIPVFKGDGGQGSAYNAGFKVSHGDIVIFLDADDILLPQAVRRIVDVWSPEVSRVLYRLRIVDRERRPQDHYFPPLNHKIPTGDLKRLLLTEFVTVGGGNAYARRFLERILPMPEAEWRVAADTYLFTLCALYGNQAFIGEPQGYYRYHGDNASMFLAPNSAFTCLYQGLPSPLGYSPRKPWLSDNGPPFVDRLARGLQYGLQAESAVLRKARELNLKVPPNLALRSAPFAECSLALRVLGPDRHQSPPKSLPWLAFQTARAIWTYSDFRRRTRILHTIWLILMLFSPARAAEVWATWLWYPDSRPRVLKDILGT